MIKRLQSCLVFGCKRGHFEYLLCRYADRETRHNSKTGWNSSTWTSFYRFHVKNLPPERFIRQMNIRCTKKSKVAVTATLGSKKFSNEPYISGLLFNILSLLPQVLWRRIYNSISLKEILMWIKIPISSTSNFFPRSSYEPSKLDERRKYVNIRTRIPVLLVIRFTYLRE